MNGPGDLPTTQLLANWRKGDSEAGDVVLERMYPELKRLAAYYLRRDWPGNTLSATALVGGREVCQRTRSGDWTAIENESGIPGSAHIVCPAILLPAKGYRLSANPSYGSTGPNKRL